MRSSCVENRPIALRMETVKDAHAVPHSVAPLAPPPPMPAPPTAPTTLAPPKNLPAPSVAVPASAPTALDRIVASVAGVRGAVLASVDGFLLAKSESMPSEPAHAAMLAAAMGLARQLVVMGGGATLRQLVVDHDGGLLLVWPIGSQRVLAVLADARIDQRMLRNFVQANVTMLADRLAVDPTDCSESVTP
jgi:predicted regulator of Ras-like GTPase activity (Roadblock/LC7/MglB family)